MANINKTLIASQQGAVSASSTTQFEVMANPVTISATVLATTEEVDFTYSGDGGVTFTRADDFTSGSPLVLTATKQQATITGEGIYRVAKDVTATACAVNAVQSSAGVVSAPG